MSSRIRSGITPLLWMFGAFSSIIILMGVVAGCSWLAPTNPGTTPAQVIADVQGGVQGMINVIPALETTTPPVITHAQGDALLADLKQANILLHDIGANSPAQTAATTLARVEGYYNAALSVLAAQPIPPPYNLIILAVSVISPEVEAYINQVIPAPPSPIVAARKAKAEAKGMTLVKAREKLGIRDGV